MFGWLRSLFSGNPSRQTRPFGGVVVRAGAWDDVATHRLELDRAKHIETALTDLANVGITLSPILKTALRATAEKIAALWEGGISFFSREPTPGDWALLALSAEPGTFENSIFLQDHCFDVAQLHDFRHMIGEILALAGDEWSIQSVDVKDAPYPAAAIGWPPLTVTINAEPEVAPFELMHAKDFDWSIVFRLNERLPKGALGRFAIFLDGNATIVFLTPENVRRLNSLCGCEFSYEENPRGRDAQT
jgi:hypothetical protein